MPALFYKMIPMKKLDRQVYLRDMDEITAERVARIKAHYDEKTSKKAVERLIHNFFPLVEDYNNVKKANIELRKTIADQQFEFNALIIRVKALLRNEADREEIKQQLNDALGLK